MKPTEEQYAAYQYLFDFLNERLFDNELPACMLTFSDRNKKIEGHFAVDSWQKNQQTVHEISLNPEYVKSHTLPEVLAVLAHQMVHVWQVERGQPSRNGYHNREWAGKMKAIGLTPVSTSEADGEEKETGQQISQRVKPGGRFEQAYQALASGSTIPFQTFGELAGRERGTGEREKYSCAGCGQNIWAKPGVKALCGQCGLAFESEQNGADSRLEEQVYHLLRARFGGGAG
jgi:predicted SprT family Zn-dependent metalloprotease